MEKEIKFLILYLFLKEEEWNGLGEEKRKNRSTSTRPQDNYLKKRMGEWKPGWQMFFFFGASQVLVFYLFISRPLLN